MSHFGTFAAWRAKNGCRISLQTHDLDRVRLTGHPKMSRCGSSTRSGEKGSRDKKDRVFSGIAQAFDGCSPHGHDQTPSKSGAVGCKKKAPATTGRQGRSVIDAPSTWLSLAGLLPSIARLRFTRRCDYNCARPSADSAPQNRIQNRPNAPTGSEWIHWRATIAKPTTKKLQTAS